MVLKTGGSGVRITGVVSGGLVVIGRRVDVLLGLCVVVVLLVVEVHAGRAVVLTG